MAIVGIAIGAITLAALRPGEARAPRCPVLKAGAMCSFFQPSNAVAIACLVCA
ncbi:MAG: hypothetical protein HOY79_38355 [Streptomyces sp.]|nr:hypothetical protein [Streptomyces sp.]